MDCLAAVAGDVQLAAGYAAVWLDVATEVPRSVSGARDFREWSRHVVRHTPATLINLYVVAVLLDALLNRYRLPEIDQQLAVLDVARMVRERVLPSSP